MVKSFDDLKTVALEITTELSGNYDDMTEGVAIAAMTNDLVATAIKGNALRVLALACATLAIGTHRGTLPGIHRGNRCGCPDCVDTAPCATAEPPDAMVEAFKTAWNATPEGAPGDRTRAGLTAALTMYRQSPQSPQPES